MGDETSKQMLNAGAMLQQAMRLIQSGQAAAGAAICKQVLAARKGQPDALHLLALSFKARGDMAAAERHFRAALRSNPHQPAVWNNLANMLSQAGRVDDALDAYAEAVRLEPRYFDGWINLGLTALEAGRNDRAVAALERAIDIAPKAAKAWHGLGTALRRRGDFDAAARAYRRCLELDGANGAVWISLAYVLRLQGELTEALKCLDAAAAAGFAGPELLDGRGACLLDMGRVEESLACYRQLTRQFAQYVPGQQALSKILWQFDFAEDPLARLKDACRAWPRHFPLHHALLQMLMQMEAWEEAAEVVAALRRVEDQPALIGAEALVRSHQGDDQAAFGLFEDAVRQSPRDTDLRNAYARYLLRRKDPARAAAQARAAIDIDPRSQAAWAYQGTAWRLLGDPREDWLYDYDRLAAPIDIEPPAGYSDLSHFTTALRERLDALHREGRAPVDQTLRGGTQTSGVLLNRREPEIMALRQAIETAIKRHISALPDDAEHPFLRHKTQSCRFTGSWSVKLKSSGFHINHIHAEGWLSSAYYVSLPPAVLDKAQDHAGWLQLGAPPVDLGLDLPPRKFIEPRVGRLALFPSYMWHGTVPFIDDSPRMTVAFDAAPD